MHSLTAWQVCKKVNGTVRVPVPLYSCSLVLSYSQFESIRLRNQFELICFERSWKFDVFY